MSKMMFGENFEEDFEDFVYHSMDGKKEKVTYEKYSEIFVEDILSISRKIMYLFFENLSKLPWSPQAKSRQTTTNLRAAFLKYAKNHL